MFNNFDSVLKNAIKQCNYDNDTIYLDTFFYRMYPFTTESIGGYIGEFDLYNKSLLTIGSSGDQVINAYLNGASDITLIDIAPYTKYYCYLKFASLIALDYDEFLNFLRYLNYPKKNITNKNIFNKKSYLKVREVLKEIDAESFIFWDTLFSKFDPELVEYSLFFTDNYSNEEIIGSNPYLSDYNLFLKAKKTIKDINLKVINNNILNEEFNRSFDNIWLSNIVGYLSSDEYINLTVKMQGLLNPSGDLLMEYFYGDNITLTDIDKSMGLRLVKFPRYENELLKEKKESALILKKY